MKLPEYAHVTVSERKIRDYLLSSTHPGGRSKARYFLRFGFTASAWPEFANALRRHAAENEVTEIVTTSRGISYTVEGELAPHLVTAYPMKKGAGR
jgi:hypothetical protein